MRIREAWFEFKGIRSDTMGIRLRQMPTRFMPGRNITRETVSGRHGGISIGDGCFKDVQVRIECDALDESKFSQLFAWLTGDGSLRFSDEPGYTYDACIIKEYSRAPIYPRSVGQRFIIVWTCAPFKRIYPEPSSIVIASSGTTINNIGTAPAQPRLTIRGTGGFSVTIGKQTMFFSKVEQGIIIDSELMDALTLDGSLLANDKITGGDFFTIEPGRNVVQWLEGGVEDESGSVQSITIEPRWRCF